MVLCAVYNHVGMVYDYMADYNNSLLYYQKSLTIAQRDGGTAQVYWLMFNCALAYWRSGKPQEGMAMVRQITAKYPTSDHYLRTESLVIQVRLLHASGHWQEATPLFDELYPLIKNVNISTDKRHNMYSGVIPYLISARRYDIAREYLNETQANIKNLPLVIQYTTEKRWYQLDSAQGNLAGALDHFRKFKVLSDSVYNINKNKELGVARARFETDLKDRNLKAQQDNIANLRRQTQLQASNLRNTRMVRNITMGSVLLLLVIIGLLWNRYRLKQRSSKIINQRNESLKQLVQEKEWLLKEIHHRVKNNLQIIMSLLESQSAYMDDDDHALVAIRDSQHRVHSMSLIHQKLYQVENLATIDMSLYVQELVEYLKDGFTTGQRIRFEMRLDPVELDVAQAIPVGLILNEAITNSIKYAFPGNREGRITIQLQQHPESFCTLSIHDNGIGLPPDFNIDNTTSLGMSLIKGLADDLDGSFTIGNAGGVTLHITFRIANQVGDAANFHLNKSVAV
jgi:two-component system, sensor histidine kinase PdtaS